MRLCLAILLLLFYPSIEVQAQEFPEIVLTVSFEFGTEGDQEGQFNEPRGISVDPEGKIYVADTGNNRIQQFNKSGEFLKQIGGFGWEKEQFDQPVEICAKNGLDVLVADYNNERIERYDKYLNYISSYYADESLSDDLLFGFPRGVSISNHGELFLVDGENYRILKINSFGEPELSFGDFRWGDGQLERPCQIEVTDHDIVYVCDEATNRIAVYDYYGNYTGEIGREILKNPHGITCDAAGRVWCADTGNNRIMVFDSNGKTVLTFGGKGDRLGAFYLPADIAVSRNRVYVLDSGNSRVQVFEIIEEK